VRLAREGVDIKALEVTERGDGDFGQVHLIASRIDRAIAALDGGGFRHSVEKVLAVEMDDRVGGLAAVLDVLANESINIDYLYAFISRVHGKSVAVFHVADIDAAEQMLQKAGLTVATQDKIEDAEGEEGGFRTTLADHFGKDFIW
jgi:hypothetical protein